MLDEDIADVVVDSNKFCDHNYNDLRISENQNIQEHWQGSRVHVVPTSDHNMQMDNPKALANLIINDIYGDDLPVEDNQNLVHNFE